MKEKQMIFKFKVLSVEDELFIRDYELRYDSTLLDFHQLMCDDLGFESEEMASFFLSNKSWGKVREFTLVDMDLDEEEKDEDSPLSMDAITLSQLVTIKHERLIYSFDLLNDRGLFIELIESHAGKESIDYPRVAFSEGKAPAQNGDEREGAIFSEMMGDFNDEFDEGGFDGDFDGDFDSYDDDNNNGNYNDDYY